jgi:glutamyl-tRNA synthetase
MASASGVVTRFAPSPTGFLHIGGARTALFNWLYAHHTGGKFLLRIEDTDRARSTQAAIDAIIDGLKWLELDWEGEPWHQFSMAKRHKQVAHQLLDEGKAYRCYSTPEELAAMRERAMKEGRAPGYDGAWRERAPKDWPKDAPYAVRLKAPREGETVVEDRVQGRVTWQNKDLDDMVLLRSDGTPTYMLAVVVDDHDMGITHIIRGDDHLTNAARQTQIYNAMGWGVPSFSHIPLIHGPDGAKLSKRHGALGVEAYRAMGYLPAAMRNYLARLGWSHGDDEIFSTEQAIEWFDLDAIGRSPSRFDFAKLENLNGHYIRQTPDADLVQRMLEILPQVTAETGLHYDITPDSLAKLEQAMSGLKERAKTLRELWDSANYLFYKRVFLSAQSTAQAKGTASPTIRPGVGSPIPLDEKAAKLLEGDARKHLAALHERFAKLDAWEPGALEAATRAYAEEAGAKLGGVAQPLRAALTGRTTSPPIFDVLSVLGRDESLARIADQAGR